MTTLEKLGFTLDGNNLKGDGKGLQLNLNGAIFFNALYALDKSSPFFSVGNPVTIYDNSARRSFKQTTVKIEVITKNGSYSSLARIKSDDWFDRKA